MMMRKVEQLESKSQQQVTMDVPKIIAKEEAEKWLIEKGVKKRDKDGKWDKRAAFAAARNGNLQVLRWLHSVSMLDAKETDEDGANAAHHAAWYGALNVLKWLQSVNMLDAKEKDKDGCNVAHYVSSDNSDLEVLK